MVMLHVYLLQTQSYDITGLAPYQLVRVTITAANDGEEISRDSNVVMNRTSETGIVVGSIFVTYG